MAHLDVDSLNLIANTFFFLFSFSYIFLIVFIFCCSVLKAMTDISVFSHCSQYCRSTLSGVLWL